MRKNGKIQLLRFVGCMIVLFYHLGNDYFQHGKTFFKYFTFFAHGKTAVEFFFILSGFLMAKSIVEESKSNQLIGKATANYLCKKIRPIIVPHFLVVFLAIGYIIAVSENPIKEIISKLPSAFFLQQIGLIHSSFIRVEWYISSLLLAISIIYPMLRKNYDITSRIIAPVGSVVLFGYLINKYSALPVKGEYIFDGGNVRALAGVLLGVFSYEVSRYIRKGNLSLKNMRILVAAENICYIVFMAYTVSNISGKSEGIVAITVAFAVSVTFSRDFNSKLYNNKLVYFLGEISLPVYLSQNFVRTIVANQLDGLRIHQKMIIAVAVTVVLGIIISFVSKEIYKLQKELFDKGKNYGNDRITVSKQRKCYQNH